MAEPISYLVNKNLSEGVFQIKNASVIPIHKTELKSNPNNYRPTSMKLPTLTKYLKNTLLPKYKNDLKSMTLYIIFNQDFVNIIHVAPL